MSVQSIDRAFDILELLSVEPGGLSLTDIGRRLNLHKSTVHRILTSLKIRGYIEKDATTGKYKLGIGFVELAGEHLSGLELTTEARPFLHTLAKRAGQTAFLAISENRDVVYIDKAESFQSLRRYKIIGRRRPLHATSLGKALLSGMPDERIAWLYNGVDFEPILPNTINSLPGLLAELRKTRERGWAFDDEENEAGTQCVGAPIFDYRREVIAAVSVAWERAVYPDVDVDRMAALIMETAKSISARMGYGKRE